MQDRSAYQSCVSTKGMKKTARQTVLNSYNLLILIFHYIKINVLNWQKTQKTKD